MPLPLTTNGRVDRRACLPASTPGTGRNLCSWHHRGVASRESGANPGIERVGIHDNFFELGGHSLLATQVISHLGKAFQVELPLRRLFEAPVFSLAEQIEMAIKAKPGLTHGLSSAFHGRSSYRCLCSAATMVPPPLRSRLYRLWSRCATARVAQRGGTRAEHQRNCAATRSGRAFRLEGRPVQKIVSALSVCR